MLEIRKTEDVAEIVRQTRKSQKISQTALSQASNEVIKVVSSQVKRIG